MFIENAKGVIKSGVKPKANSWALNPRVENKEQLTVILTKLSGEQSKGQHRLYVKYMHMRSPCNYQNFRN